MKQCQAVSYLGTQCTQAQGHVGPHKVGNPYHPAEWWPQEGCKRHSFHLNSNGEKADKRVEWEECLFCGERR